MEAKGGGAAGGAVKVENWKIDRVLPYERNPRDNVGAVDKVATSIKEFGFRQPIVVDDQGVVIAGHTRLLAAKKLGLERVPVHVAVGLSPTKVAAYRLADNRTHEEARWLDDLLAEELRALDAAGYQMGLMGFDEHEVAKILSVSLRKHVDGEDFTPDLQQQAVVRRGERWQLGDHVLVCGDATSKEDVASALEHAEPRLMVTDPPYGVSYEPAWRQKAGFKPNKSKLGTVTNDDRVDWSEAWKLFPGAVAYVWCAGRFIAEVQRSLEAADFGIRSQIVWVKDRFALSRGHYHWQHEPALYAARAGGSGFQATLDDLERVEPSHEVADDEHRVAFYAANGPTNWQGSRSESTVWMIPAREDRGHGHPTQKPVECMLRPMLNNSARGDAVYDPFCGSGSSVIAAEKSGRICVAIELEPLCCDVIIRRWQQFACKTAKLGRTSFAKLEAARG
jgi:DNA modification methylase